MKKLIILFLMMIPGLMAAQMTYVPDDNFEQALIDLGYDTPPLNDSVPTKNIDTVTNLYLFNKQISDLTGIEDFINLKWLECKENQLTRLDLTENSALEVLWCTHNKLTSLDVSKNSALLALYCYVNQLTVLDVSKNPALLALYCDNNQLSILDVRYNPALTDFSCSANNLTNLDVGNNPTLSKFNCGYNMLTTLDVSSNPALRDIQCQSNLLTCLDVSDNPELKNLYCFNNQLTKMDISKNPKLNYFDASLNYKLFCIQVIDSLLAANNPTWRKDSTAHFSENCNYTGVDENSNINNSISISPNPAPDYIEISYPPSGEGAGGVSIFNLLGTEVKHISQFSIINSQLKIDVSGLAPGVYFVRMSNVMKKFVKI